MHKKLLSAALAAALTLSLAGCGSGEGADRFPRRLYRRHLRTDGTRIPQRGHARLQGRPCRGLRRGRRPIFRGERARRAEQLRHDNRRLHRRGRRPDTRQRHLAAPGRRLRHVGDTVLGTSVTDYATALDLGGFDGVIGTNVSGTSDLVPLEDQAALIKELFPEAGTVGLLYCSGEPNSVYQVETVRAELEGMGYACEAYAFTDANDLGAVAQTACDGSDLIYIPTDNTVAANTETVANVVIPAGVPVVGGDPGICSGCGVATITCDYYELGRLTGGLAAEILRGETDISALPVQYLEPLKVYNAENCSALGVKVPEGYTPLG